MSIYCVIDHCPGDPGSIEGQTDPPVTHSVHGRPAQQCTDNKKNAAYRDGPLLSFVVTQRRRDSNPDELLFNLVLTTYNCYNLISRM